MDDKEIDLADNPILKALLQAALDEADIEQEAVALFPGNMLLAKHTDGGFSEWPVVYEDDAYHVNGW